jgi:outer membrane protein insertion porin family
VSRVGLCLLLLSASAASTAAQIPERLRDRRIVRVRLSGEAGAMRPEDLGFREGGRLSRRALRERTRALLESGDWADVQIDATPVPGGVALTVELRPRILVARVDIVGEEALDARTVRQALELGPQRQVERSELETLAERVADVYAERGYVDATVEVRLLDTDDPTRKVLRIQVREGEALRVGSLIFGQATIPEDAERRLRDGLRLEVGAILDRSDLRERVRLTEAALREGGWLEASLSMPRVQRRNGVATVEVPLALGPRYEIRVLHPEPLAREQVEAVLDLGEEPLTAASQAALDERVEELYRRHGFHRAEVTVTRRVRGDRAELRVGVAAGPQLRVVELLFPGARHFDADELRNQALSILEDQLPDNRVFSPVDSEQADRIGLSGRQMTARRSMARPLSLDPASIYHRPSYDRVLAHLAELYEAQGYLDVEVGPARLVEGVDDTARVVVPVREGPRTLLYDLVLEGNEALSAAELLEVAALRRGEPFSRQGLAEAAGRMLELYQERSYLYARVDNDVRFSRDRTRAQVTLTVVERFPVAFGEVTIEGTRRTSDRLVRELLRFREGDPFRPSLVEASQQALLALGVFNAVSITPDDPELAERVKSLTIRVAERPPFFTEFRAGLSTGQGVRAGGELSYRNLFGYAVQPTFRAQAAYQFIFQDATLERNITSLQLIDRLERRITLSLVIPHITGLDNVRTSLDGVHVRDNERAFGLDKTGGVLSMLWSPLDRLRLQLSSELTNNNVRLLGDVENFEEFVENQTDPRLLRLLRVPEGDSLVFSQRIELGLDLRDSPFVPTEGIQVLSSVEWVYTLDTEQIDPLEAPFFSNFLKVGLTFRGYVSLGDVVFVGVLRGGYIQHLEDRSETYPNRQYFLGGVDSLRGFNQDQVQPQDVFADTRLQPTTVTLGGDFYMLGRAELRIPLFANLQAGVFTDIGNHWRDPTRIVETFALRPTAGLGLRIVTPVGPLALDYGFNLDRREQLSEPFGAFHFSIGLF